MCEFVSGDVCLVYVSAIKTTTHDRNDLKLGTVVPLDTMSKPIDFRFKRLRVTDTGSKFRNSGTSCQLAYKNKIDYIYNIKLQCIE